jgi:hypothetical protein
MQISLNHISVAQLRRAVTIKEQMESLEKELASVLDAAPAVPTGPAVAPRKKRTMSAAGRARIAAAQKARGAKLKKTTTPAVKPAPNKKRKLSPEGRTRIIAATKARWAKIRAANKAAKKAM